MEALYYPINIKLLTNKPNKKYKTQEQLLFYPRHIMKITKQRRHK